MDADSFRPGARAGSWPPGATRTARGSLSRPRALARGLLRPVYALYARRLWQQVHGGGAVPRHLAVILDGNRRFTRRSGLDSVEQGYATGGERVFDVLKWSQSAGIRAVTLWAASLDNLQRPPEDLEPLFCVLEETVRNLTTAATREGWCLRVIGRRELLPSSLREALDQAEDGTTPNRKLVVQLAIGYGGREEIVDAVRRWASDGCVRGLPVEEALFNLTPEQLQPHLYGGDLPDPDLILRTSGEVRLSGFLLWQSVYSEFYFTDVLWPAFREVDFLRALRSYQGRHRRFGF